MKKIILILTIWSQAASAVEYMNCEFGFANVPILMSQTQLVSEDKIGEFSKVNFQGSPQKTIPNMVLPTHNNEKFKFQLDEGFGDNNIFIVVSSQRLDENKYPALAENPQTPAFKKMQGVCEIF